MEAYDYEAITVATAAIGFTAAKITADASTGNFGPQKASVSVETAQVRYTVHGVDPSTTLGHVLNAGDRVDIEGPIDILRFKAIRTGGDSASLKVTYFR